MHEGQEHWSNLSPAFVDKELMIVQVNGAGYIQRAIDAKIFLYSLGGVLFPPMLFEVQILLKLHMVLQHRMTKDFAIYCK